MNPVKRLLKKITKPSILLLIIFLLLLCYEGYVLYFKVYGSLWTEAPTVPTERIVRLDLESYAKTLNLMDALQTFTPPAWPLTNSSPFK